MQHRQKPDPGARVGRAAATEPLVLERQRCEHWGQRKPRGSIGLAGAQRHAVRAIAPWLARATLGNGDCGTSNKRSARFPWPWGPPCHARLDSTVSERYGRQEGSLKGYNPGKHGRPSYHPLMAILAETLAQVPEDFRFYAVHADSGFFRANVLRNWGNARCRTCRDAHESTCCAGQWRGFRQWQSFAPGF
jgi:hypothetical protein